MTRCSYLDLLDLRICSPNKQNSAHVIKEPTRHGQSPQSAHCLRLVTSRANLGVNSRVCYMMFWLKSYPAREIIIHLQDTLPSRGNTRGTTTYKKVKTLLRGITKCGSYDNNYCSRLSWNKGHHSMGEINSINDCQTHNITLKI